MTSGLDIYCDFLDRLSFIFFAFYLPLYSLLKHLQSLSLTMSTTVRNIRSTRLQDHIDRQRQIGLILGIILPIDRLEAAWHRSANELIREHNVDPSNVRLPLVVKKVIDSERRRELRAGLGGPPQDRLEQIYVENLPGGRKFGIPQDSLTLHRAVSSTSLISHCSFTGHSLIFDSAASPAIYRSSGPCIYRRSSFWSSHKV